MTTLLNSKWRGDVAFMLVVFCLAVTLVGCSSPRANGSAWEPGADARDTESADAPEADSGGVTEGHARTDTDADDRSWVLCNPRFPYSDCCKTYRKESDPQCPKLRPRSPSEVEDLDSCDTTGDRTGRCFYCKRSADSDTVYYERNITTNKTESAVLLLYYMCDGQVVTVKD